MFLNTKNTDVAKRFASKGVFPHQMAFTLLIPLRNIFLSPKKLIQRLGLKEDMQVMELGPGPGYFSVPVARRLLKGRLVLADIQSEMLEYARKRLEKRKLFNLDYYICDGNTFQFEDTSFDIIYMVTVIGEVEQKEAYMAEFYRMLKPEGILSITELAGDPDKLTIEDVKRLASALPFKSIEVFGTPKNYTIQFRK